MPETKSILPRPPVVAVMGHIDHGKSTLLDYIRNTNVVAKEAGGITQHISAYEVAHGEGDHARRITFLDTPGHEAFGRMRSRGAQVADVAILIVSAEDGVKTQTLEAYQSIKEADIPYIVAINKIDKPNADIERTKNTLLENEIYLEGLGGDVPYAPISAKSGEGIPELLDLLLLAADLEELSGDMHQPATGAVVESNIDTQKGISATLVIKNGSIKNGMFVVAGNAIAPVRIMEDFRGQKITEASFSSPIRIVGFNNVPAVGSPFQTYDSKKEAETAVADAESALTPAAETVTNDDEEQSCIPLIIKADVLGSIDAIEHEIEKIHSDRVDIRIVHKGAGAISESDVKAAGGKANTIVVGFHVSVDSRAKDIAERNGIEVKTFDIIYELAEWLRQAIQDRIPKVEMEEVSGRAKILKVFSNTKDRYVLGFRVEEGSLELSTKVKVMRTDEEVARGVITNLQRMKEKVQTATDGEYGAEVQSNVPLEPGDIIEAYSVVVK